MATETSARNSTQPTLEKIQIIEQQIISDLARWHRWAVWLYSLYVIFGTIAVLASVFVTTCVSGWQKVPNVYVVWTSFISTASLTLMTTFNLGKKANNWREARMLLEFAYTKYQANSIDLNELIEARHNAEALIGGIDFQYNVK